MADIGRVQGEFAEWVVYLMIENGFMEPQIGAVLTFGERVDEERMARAVRLLMEAEPILGCRLVLEGRVPTWQRHVDLDSAPFFRLGAVQEADGFLAARVDPCDGPQVQALLARGEADRLMLKFDHVALDAGGVKQALYTLADIYRRLAADPAYVPARNEAPRNMAAAAKGRGLGEKLRALRTGTPSMDPPGWGFPSRSQDRGRETYVMRHVDPARFRALRAYGKERGATVNDVLLTAYWRALFAMLDLGEGGTKRVQLSCDLRPYLPTAAEVALSNLSSTWSTALECEPAESFDTTLARVVEQSRAWKASEPGLAAAVGARIMGPLVSLTGLNGMRAQMKKVDLADDGYPVLTNLGVLDEQRLDFGQDLSLTEAFVIGPIAFPPGFVLAASTFRDTLTLSTGFSAEALDPDLVESLLDRVENELPAAIAAAG